MALCAVALNPAISYALDPCIDVDYDVAVLVSDSRGPYRGQIGNSLRPIGEELDGDLHTDVIRSLFVTDSIGAPLNDIEFGWHVHPGDSDLTVFAVWHINGVLSVRSDLGHFLQYNPHIRIHDQNADGRWRGTVDGVTFLNNQNLGFTSGAIAGALAERHNHCDEGGVLWYNLATYGASGVYGGWEEMVVGKDTDPLFDCFKALPDNEFETRFDELPADPPNSPCVPDLDPLFP